jgi:hypothetical protein
LIVAVLALAMRATPPAPAFDRTRQTAHSGRPGPEVPTPEQARNRRRPLR